MSTIVVPACIAKLADMICACESNEETWGAILQRLDELDRHTSGAKHSLGLTAVLCDHVGAEEHVSSIRHAWLTPEGEKALAFLREHGIDWRDKDHFFVDVEGVYYGGTGT